MKKLKTVLAKGMGPLVITCLDDRVVSLNSRQVTCTYLFIFK